jgi:hypothetical protein
MPLSPSLLPISTSDSGAMAFSAQFLHQDVQPIRGGEGSVAWAKAYADEDSAPASTGSQPIALSCARMP